LQLHFDYSFLYSYVSHRDLHSFPTRRSSDLLEDAEQSTRALGASGLTDPQLLAIDAVRASCLATPVHGVLSPIQQAEREDAIAEDRKSTRLNSSHVSISYAVFCLKKKKKKKH